jgi:hypothetical protein
MEHKVLKTLHADTYKTGGKNKSKVALARTDQGLWQEKLYRLQKFLEACEQLPPELEDVYFSLNGFGPHRRLDCLVQINCLFADLDIYSLFQNTELVMDTVKELIPESIPRPGVIAYSGRGLWLIWPIEPLPRQALHRWMKLQDTFIKALRHLGADTKVRDVTRVMRLPGSVNGKNKQPVRFEIWQEERYAFHQLEQLYLPQPKHKPARPLAVLSSAVRLTDSPTADAIQPGTQKSRNRSETQVHPRFFTPYSLNITIIEDLKRLADMRGRKLKGHREYFLFIWRNALAQLGLEAHESERQLRSVALQYLGSERLPDKEWVQSTMSAYRASFEREDGTITQGYRLTKDWIINALAITPEEQQQLQLLICTLEKYRRNNAKRRLRRAKKTRAEYLNAAQQKSDLIRQLKAEHPKATYRQLANMANCSLGAVFNALKK